MSEFINCESYKKKFAKKIVKSWIDSYGEGYEWKKIKLINNKFLSFRSNRESGIWENYPVTIFEYENYLSSSIQELWDETINYDKEYPEKYDLYLNEALTYYNIDISIKEWKKYCKYIYEEDRDFLKQNKDLLEKYFKINSFIDEKYRCNFSNYAPTYSQSIKYGKTIKILDLAIAHKGLIKYGIIMTDKKTINYELLKKLKESGLENLIEIDSDWVLEQTERPDFIKIKKFLIENGEICE